MAQVQECSDCVLHTSLRLRRRILTKVMHLGTTAGNACSSIYGMFFFFILKFKSFFNLVKNKVFFTCQKSSPFIEDQIQNFLRKNVRRGLTRSGRCSRVPQSFVTRPDTTAQGVRAHQKFE
jgi:hypothetical protein